MFVVVGDDVKKCGGRVNHSPTIHGIDDLLACGATEKHFAFRNDSNFKSGHLALVTTLTKVAEIVSLGTDTSRRILKWVERGD